MITGSWKTAWRLLRKDRQFSLLNVAGLAAGMACTLLIGLWVADELAIDQFQSHDNRLYQVMVNHPGINGVQTGSETPALLASTIKREFPEVEFATASVPTIGLKKTTLSVGDNLIRAVGQYADNDYFQAFSWPILQGDRSRLLADKQSIVLSRNLALKLFHTTDNIIGKSVQFQHGQTFIVSGIFDGAFTHSSLQFDFVLSFDEFLDDRPEYRQWTNADPHTYVVLRAGADRAAFDRKLSRIFQSKIPRTTATLSTVRFASTYLYGNFENGQQVPGRARYVHLFSAIALFILLIACINFMNLSTAKASQRMKEIGVRKCLGSTRRGLVGQFLTESMFMSGAALVLAVVAVAICLGPFNHLTGKHLDLHPHPATVLLVVGITLATGLISGSYPAFYLSRFRPVAVLKGQLHTSAGELWTRRGLVVFQFSLSMLFIVAVLVIYRQMSFIQSTNKGFDKENTVVFTIDGDASTPEAATAYLSTVRNILAQVRATPGVVSASSMDHESIIADYGTTGDFQWSGKDPNLHLDFGNIGFNYGMIETLGMQMAAGRSFSAEKSSDSSEIIFNQVAIDQMGLKDPVGKVVRMWGIDRRIAGVVKNFHFESLHEAIKPFAIRLEPALTDVVVARISRAEEGPVVEALRGIYEQYNAGFLFDYHFLDEDYQAQYVAEARVSALTKYFAGLAILISCLGLFGLTAFTVQARKKEMGIRKVVGASAGTIFYLFSIDFIKWVSLSVLLALPLAWWACTQWLSGFVYRIDIGAGTLAIAAATVLSVTLVTVSFQALKASRTNPVSSLKGAE